MNGEEMVLHSCVCSLVTYKQVIEGRLELTRCALFCQHDNARRHMVLSHVICALSILYCRRGEAADALSCSVC
jgi:hypothetical protein